MTLPTAILENSDQPSSVNQLYSQSIFLFGAISLSATQLSNFHVTTVHNRSKYGVTDILDTIRNL